MDEAWLRLRANLRETPWLRLDQFPGADRYLYGTVITVLTGAAKGYIVPLERMENDIAVIGAGFGLDSMPEMLEKIQPGDEVLLDNSNYIALQTYHRHQVPDTDYEGWRQFKDKAGNPIYPQRSFLLGPGVAFGGAGSTQSGDFNGKMIVVAALMDESAFPWQADWYRQRVREHAKGAEEDRFRLWYIENALHDDRRKTVDDLHVVSYLGALHQALLDVSAWVEQGKAPAPSSRYQIEDGQVTVPGTAAERAGIQPVIRLTTGGSDRAEVSAGEEVCFLADVALPEDAGVLTDSQWSFAGEKDYPVQGSFAEINENRQGGSVKTCHVFQKPGVYFPTLRVTSSREPADPFTQVMNIARVRVVVK